LKFFGKTKTKRFFDFQNFQKTKIKGSLILNFFKIENSGFWKFQKIPPTFVVNVIQIGSYREHLMAWRNRWRVIRKTWSNLT
jgi:hypothetical protein